MPVSPAMAEDLAAEVARLYEDTEAALLERLAAALEADIESPRWAELKLAAVGNLRTAVETVAEALQRDTDGAVRRALVEAYNRGRQAAVAELGALDIGRELAARETLPNAPAVDRLAASLAADTRPLYVRITRSVVDAYQRVVARASGTVLLGAATRREASQRALNEFAKRGITGFVDKAGKAWSLASYAEMAVRSVTARAAIEGHVDALLELGQTLVIVSDAPLECPLCARWEGEVLAINGQAGPHTVIAEHAAPPEQPRRGLLRRRGPAPTVAVHVAGSLEEARRLGLFHPNCRLPTLPCDLPAGRDHPPAAPRDPGHVVQRHAAAARDRAAHPPVEARPGCGHERCGAPPGGLLRPQVAGGDAGPRGRARAPAPQARTRTGRHRPLRRETRRQSLPNE